MFSRCRLALAVQQSPVLSFWQPGVFMLLCFPHARGQRADDEGGLDLSSHNMDSVAIVSHWPCGAQWCRPGQEGQRWQLAHPATARSEPLSAPTDSPLNPEALNFTQIGKSHTKLRQNDPNDNEGLA